MAGVAQHESALSSQQLRRPVAPFPRREVVCQRAGDERLDLDALQIHGLAEDRQGSGLGQRIVLEDVEELHVQRARQIGAIDAPGEDIETRRIAFGMLLLRIAPARREELYSFADGMLREAPPARQVHEIVLADRRDDHQGRYRIHPFRRRAVLKQFQHLVAKDDSAGRCRQVFSQLEVRALDLRWRPLPASRSPTMFFVPRTRLIPPVS